MLTIKIDSTYLAGGVEHGLVVGGRARRHHHATTDGVQGVRGETSTGRDTPTEEEGGKEVALKRADENDGL